MTEVPATSTTTATATSTNASELSDYYNKETLAVINGERTDWVQLYTTVIAAAFENLGVPEDTNSAVIFLTTITLVIVGLGIVAVFNLYCTHRGRKSAKKQYYNLHDGIKVPLRTMSTRQRSQSQPRSSDDTV